MLSPLELMERLPPSPGAAVRVALSRQRVARALGRGCDDPAAGPRLLVLGPCSLHDPDAALEYAAKLAGLSRAVGDTLVIAMRAYVEKSRTGLGWRGLAEEPGLDGVRDPVRGVEAARRLLVDLEATGLPIGVEIVSPHLWRYWIDVVSWAAVGARGTESQALREAAAALPVPCAFKNRLDGAVKPAVNAALVASRACSFAGPGPDGSIAVLKAPGNPLPHVCLRGGRPVDGRRSVPNAGRASRTGAELLERGLVPAVIVDLGHDNSFLPGRLPRPGRRLISDLRSGTVRGLMLESNLEPGNQPPGPVGTLRRGVSVTDPCVGWADTERFVAGVAESLS